VKLISSLLGIEVSVIEDGQRVRSGKSEVERLWCNNSKIKEITDWSPSYNLEKGLKETIDFLRSNLERYKPEAYNV